VRLICRTYTSTWEHDGCTYAVLEVTGELLLRVAGIQETAMQLETSMPGFYTVTAWDSSVEYLDSIPDAWEEWVDDSLNDGEWVELPFPYDRSSATPERTSGAITLSRAECMLIRSTGHKTVWEAAPKHSSGTVETPPFPEIPFIEQLALAHTPET
jgi:hypothetical protein